MFPMSNWRGPLVPHGLPRDKPTVQLHRWLGRRGSLSPPLPWLWSLDTAYLLHMIVGWSRPDPHSETLPLYISSTVGLHCHNSCRALGLHLPNTSSVEGLHLSDDCPTMGLCLPNGLSGLSLVVMKGHLKVQNLFPLSGIWR